MTPWSLSPRGVRNQPGKEASSKEEAGGFFRGIAGLGGGNRIPPSSALLLQGKGRQRRTGRAIGNDVSTLTTAGTGTVFIVRRVLKRIRARNLRA